MSDMSSVKSDSCEIYVVCPAYKKTGGMELLHQLVYALNTEGAHATIAYTGVAKSSNSCPINSEYAQYVNSYIPAQQIPDRDGVIVVLPEVDAKMVSSFKYAKIYFWWLSIDNYLKVYSLWYNLRNCNFRAAVSLIKHGAWRYALSFLRRDVNLNLVQSYYAKDYLEKHGFTNIVRLSDYINDEYIVDDTSRPRMDHILYNPKKGIEFTRLLMEAAPDLQWMPIENMTLDEVRRTLKTAKVYVDFGNHPGKDRFPREAAISGCCVLTGKRGSAAFEQDVPIPSAYKFEDSIANIPLIIEKIRECLADFSRCAHDFDGYRAMIVSEKKIFNEDVRRIFIE